MEAMAGLEAGDKARVQAAIEKDIRDGYRATCQSHPNRNNLRDKFVASNIKIAYSEWIFSSRDP